MFGGEKEKRNQREKKGDSRTQMLCREEERESEVVQIRNRTFLNSQIFKRTEKNKEKNFSNI